MADSLDEPPEQQDASSSNRLSWVRDCVLAIVERIMRGMDELEEIEEWKNWDEQQFN